MHGGATVSGAPRGNQNAVKHGRFSAKAITRRGYLHYLISVSRRISAKV
jgi:hypothetical protein